jgi:hypothetical protein
VRVFHQDRPPPVPPAGREVERVPPAAPPPVPEWTPRRGLAPVPIEELDGMTPDRALRAVLARWDFRDPAGWRGPLERLGPEEWERCAALLERFAASELRQRLAGARKLRREVEYVCQVPGSTAVTPGVCGRIDCLWQDMAGAWHLLFWVSEPVPPARQEAYLSRCLPALALAVSALRQTEATARDVAIAFLSDGGVIERPASGLTRAGTFERLARALREMADTPAGP